METPERLIPFGNGLNFQISIMISGLQLPARPARPAFPKEAGKEAKRLKVDDLVKIPKDGL
jgi:hypothetical protein